MREVFLYLKSLWNVSHLLELQLGSSRGAEMRRREVFLGLQHHTRAAVCSLSTTPWQWLCVTADIMWFLLSPGSQADDGDFWALLCSPATAMTERKKCLSVMISGIFHTAWRSLSLCPVAHASLTEKLGLYVQPEISWSGFVSVWAQSHQLTDTLSCDFRVVFFCFLTPKQILYSIQYILVCFTILSWVYSNWTTGIRRTSLLL